MKAIVTISMRPGILDPESQTIQSALTGLGFATAKSVKRSKVIELELDAPSAKVAKEQAEEMCRTLLANPVMETFDIRIEE